MELEPTDVPAGDAAVPASGTRQRLVVLAYDPTLVAAVRAVAPAEHEVIFIGAETDLAGHLMAGGAGVVLLDTAAAVSAIDQLTRDLKAQFPDVVLIVAGGAAEQSALAAQVASGDVYRFLHKPASEQRIRLFIDAAWRRRGTTEGSAATGVVAKLGTAGAARRLPLGALIGAAVAIMGAAGLGGWLLGQHGAPKPLAPPASAQPRAALRQAPTDAVLSQLLARAGEALAHGDWLLPPGGSAAELYRQALERHPGDVQALAGLDKVVDQVLSAAEQDLLAQHLEEAEHLTAAARAIAPNSVRVTFLATQVARERERAQARAQAQRQHSDESTRQQQLIAAARAALSDADLAEAARLIGVAADAGVARDAIDKLNRDLQDAQLVARMKEAPAAAAEAAAPSPQLPAAAAPQESRSAPQETPATSADDASAHHVVMAGTLERLRYTAPEYPLTARANETSGWVDLAFDVEPDGSVAHIAVLGADPKEVFDRAAVAAVRKWRYRPAERDGHAVEQRAQLRIRFTLQ